MKTVTKDEFYKEIGCRDIVIKATGNKHPYTTEFKTRSGMLVGTSFEGNYKMSDKIYDVPKPR